MATYGRLREDFVVEPVSGKALPLYRGEVLRIVQDDLVPQCVDFNCFNLHDYKERMATSIMRRQGFNLQTGSFVISDSPRERLMMQIFAQPPTCVTGTLGHRCSAAWCEAVLGTTHSNCQDSLAEAIAAYGLGPDETHAALCFWYRLGWDDLGHFVLRDNKLVKKGDYVDLLALMDVLVACCQCGINDISPLGWGHGPIRLQVFEKSPETEEVVQGVSRRYPPLTNQRIPEGSATDRELRRVPHYQPHFINFPLKFEEVEVELGDEDYKLIQRLKEADGWNTDEEAIRAAVMGWYVNNRLSQHPLHGSISLL